ncbi:MAG: DNA polymerase [Synergistes sp.]|nr:DNA polymerase [Synergistes sp.]
MKKNMLLIDGHGLAFRAFYALPDTLTAKDGTPTNAIVGFANMLQKALSEWASEAVGIFFDPGGHTKRHEMADDYKGTRKPTPESFKIQMPLIIDFCRAAGLAVIIREGIEADDCIISTARTSAAEGWNVRILSADKDLFQAITEDISVIRPLRGVTDFGYYDLKTFREKYNFDPPNTADYLALLGDSADNIPGVPGIGEKSAADLVVHFGSLENIYENIESVVKARRTKLEAGRELAFASRALVLPQNVEPTPTALLTSNNPDIDALAALCERLDLRKIAEHFGVSEEHKAKEQNETIEPNKISLSELLRSDRIALAAVGEELAAADDKGNFALFSHKDTIALAEFKKWTVRGILYICGLREFITRFADFPMPKDENVFDLEGANYLIHPDRAGLSGLEKSLGEELPDGIKLAVNLIRYYSVLGDDLEKKGLHEVMHKIDIPLSFSLAKMSLNGIHADMGKLTALNKEITASLEEHQRELDAYVGMKVNLASPKQVASLLFDTLKLPPIKKNKTGYSTGAAVLEELAALPEPMCRVPKMIINFREEAKIKGGFVEPFLKYAENSGGVIHSTFDHLATGTGRLASRNPNVQNMPVFGEWADKFRACFTPRSASGIFVAADYSQIELRVLAHYSGEEKLIDAFIAGEDIHLKTASWIFGLLPEDITAEQRHFAKTVNFGLIYGMSAFGLAQRLGIPRHAAARMIDRYFEVLPNVKAYIKDTAEMARADGCTRSFFGRIRPLAEVPRIEHAGGGSPTDRIAVNSPIQSTASDIAKIALMRFDSALAKEFPTALTILQVHDSIVCECREDLTEEVGALLVRTMEEANPLSVPLKAELKTGYTFSDI